MKWYVLLILGSVVFVYLCLGGIVFNQLESQEETGHKAFVKNFTRYFLDQHDCVTAGEMEFLVMTYIEAWERGIIEVANVSSAPNWDLASAVFFSITVITTIGYGHIYPVTGAGHAFCVVYALLGIPLCLIFLTGIGEKLKNNFRRIDNAMDICKSKYKKLEHGVRVTVILLIGLTLFLFLPALMFVFVDDWSYSDALYYCVITLTTIGFGDLVPGLDDTYGQNRSIYRVMTGVWIFIGLAWLAGVITFMQDLFTGIVDRAQSTVENKKEKRSSVTKSKESISANRAKEAEIAAANDETNDKDSDGLELDNQSEPSTSDCYVNKHVDSDSDSEQQTTRNRVPEIQTEF